MSRYAEIERQQAAARAALPAATAQWLAPLRAEIATLTRAAATGTLTDAQLLRRIQSLHTRAARLLPTLDTAPLETALAEASVQALITGVLSHSSHPSKPPEEANPAAAPSSPPGNNAASKSPNPSGAAARQL